MNNDTTAGQPQTLTPNTLAFMALCNEYCSAVEHASETQRTDFIDTMLRLLPRIYISASDISASDSGNADAYIEDVLTEDYYDAMRRGVEALMGEDDTYLDVFEEDMKYSDTPIAASISEGVADLFQVMYNYLETVRNAPDDLVAEATIAMREDFAQYWSRRLCDTMRAINALRYA